jgi:hypothetical protein
MIEACKLILSNYLLEFGNSHCGGDQEHNMGNAMRSDATAITYWNYIFRTPLWNSTGNSNLAANKNQVIAIGGCFRSHFGNGVQVSQVNE